MQINRLSISSLSSQPRGGGGPVLPQTNLLGAWWADNYTSALVPMIPNSASATAVSTNMLPAPRRLFSSLFYSRNSATVTDSAATAPDGSNDASTVVGTGNWYVGATITLPAAAHTFAFFYKRNTGTDQPFSASWDFGTKTNFTATSSWQRGTVTKTVSAGARTVQILSVDGATAANIQIVDAAVFQGSSDLKPSGETLAGHLMLGSALATYSSGLMDYSSGGYGVIQLPASVTMSAFTVMMAVTRTAAGSAYQALLSKLQSYTQWTPYLHQNDQPRLAYAGTDRYNYASGLWFRQGSGLHIMSHVYDGTTLTTYIDDVKVLTVDFTASGPTIADLFSGLVNNGSFTTGVKWNGKAVWSRALTSAELITARAVMTARAALTSNTITPPTRLCFFEGDSITEGSQTSQVSYASKFGPNASPIIVGSILAKSGARLSGNSGNSLQSRAAATDTYYRSGRTNILVVFIGANDLYRYTGGGAQYAIDVAAYCDARISTGWKVVICTVLTRTDATLSAGEITTMNTERAIYNTAVRTWVGTHAHGVADFAADATMGVDGASDNATYFVDKVHPTVAGQAILETILRPVVNAL